MGILDRLLGKTKEERVKDAEIKLIMKRAISFYNRGELKNWDQFLLGHNIHSQTIHNKA